MRNVLQGLQSAILVYVLHKLSGQEISLDGIGYFWKKKNLLALADIFPEQWAVGIHSTVIHIQFLWVLVTTTCEFWFTM